MGRPSFFTRLPRAIGAGVSVFWQALTGRGELKPSPVFARAVNAWRRGSRPGGAGIAGTVLKPFATVYVAVRAAVRAAQDALAGRLIRPVRQDYQRRERVANVTASRITAALDSAANGDLRSLGGIYDLVPATDSHIRGVRRQLLAGVTSLPGEVVPVDDSPGAERVAELVRAVVDRPDAAMRDAITGIVEGDLRGASLTEIIWNDPGAEQRRWIGFRVVPQQRLRYDLDTGALRVAIKPEDAQGVSLAEFPSKFLVTIVDRDVPDFSLRGVYRSILAEWFGRLSVGGWEMQCIERFGMPVPIGKYGREEDRQVLEGAFAAFGSAGSLVVSEGTSVEFQATSVPTSGALVHETYLEKSAQRISVALLGSQQTATVGTDQGSKASAQVHQLVRRDVLYGVWQLVSEVIRRDLFVPFVRMNLGEAAVRYTPQYLPQWDDPVDMAATASALLTISRDLGLEVGKTFARESLSIPAPEEGEEVLAPAPVAAPMGNPFASVSAARETPPPPAKPPKAAGHEITDPIESLLAGLGDDSDLKAFANALDALEPSDVPQLGDRLSAALADAYLGGKADVRKGREAR